MKKDIDQLMNEAKQNDIEYNGFNKLECSYDFTIGTYSTLFRTHCLIDDSSVSFESFWLEDKSLGTISATPLSFSQLEIINRFVKEIRDNKYFYEEASEYAKHQQDLDDCYEFERWW